MYERFINWVANHKVWSCLAFLSFLWMLGFGGFSVYAYYYPNVIESKITTITTTTNKTIENIENIENITREIIKDNIFLQWSVFDITKEINESDFTLEKRKIREWVMTLYVKDSWYLIDIDSYKGSDEKDTNTIKLIIWKDINNYETSIMCLFTDEWNNVILKLNKGDKIQFTWKISWWKNFDSVFNANKNIPLIALTKCELIK